MGDGRNSRLPGRERSRISSVSLKCDGVSRVVFHTYTRTRVHRFIQRKLNVRRNYEFLFLPLTTICSPGDLNLGNGH